MHGVISARWYVLGVVHYGGSSREVGFLCVYVCACFFVFCFLLFIMEHCDARGALLPIRGLSPFVPLYEGFQPSLGKCLELS